MATTHPENADKTNLFIKEKHISWIDALPTNHRKRSTDRLNYLISIESPKKKTRTGRAPRQTPYTFGIHISCHSENRWCPAGLFGLQKAPRGA